MSENHEALLARSEAIVSPSISFVEELTTALRAVMRERDEARELIKDYERTGAALRVRAERAERERDAARTSELITRQNRDELKPRFEHLIARAERAEARLAEYERFSGDAEQVARDVFKDAAADLKKPLQDIMESALTSFAAQADAAAVARTREEDSVIAEERHRHWRLPHVDDARPFEVCDDVSACADIAAAIRAGGK